FAALAALLDRPQGLIAEYIGTQPGGEISRAVDSEISTATLTKHWDGFAPPKFQARWTGFLVVWRTGSYTLATTSGDGSAVSIDGHLVVDNRGEHGPQTATGRIRLRPGPHAVEIEYSQVAGGYEITWAWGREDSPLSSVPSWVLWTRRVTYAR